jgi:hypothetical protein
MFAAAQNRNDRSQYKAGGAVTFAQTQLKSWTLLGSDIVVGLTWIPRALEFSGPWFDSLIPALCGNI